MEIIKMLDNSQITHLICVRLKMLLHDFFLRQVGGSGFPVLSSPFLFLKLHIKCLDFHLASPQGKS